jgi:superfamily II DNA or RNA helicase
MFRNGDLLTIRDSRWRVKASIPFGPSVVVQVVGCGAGNRGEQASFVLPFEPCGIAGAPRPRVVSPRKWRHAARAALADATPHWWSLRSATRADFAILPYQLAPALAMVRGESHRFLIADAVGLGKTVQAGLMIAEAAARQHDAKAIVICPSGLRDQWRDELTRRFGLDVQTIDGASIARMTRELPSSVNPWTVHSVAVTSIDFVKRPEVIRALEGLVWDIAVFDEAHNLTTRSDRATAADLVAGRGRIVVLLTATPHPGDDDAFLRLCGIGRLSGEDRLMVFRRSRLTIGIRESIRRTLLRVEPTRPERLMHGLLLRYAQRIWRRAGAPAGARLAASVLIRRASSSAGSLVRSVERRLALVAGTPEDPRRQSALPFDTVQEGDAEPDWQLSSPGLTDTAEECGLLEAILTAARAAATHESKTAALQRLLSRISEPAIVFTEYRDTLARIAERLDRSDIVQLHGGLTRKERAEALSEFTQGGARLLLATDAGSEGLNLHHRCRLVINFELPWMPRRLEQRGGRVDRIGQSRRVHLVSLVAKDTCEERVLSRLAARGLRAERAMNLLADGPSEQRVASMVLGDEPETFDDGHATVLPAGISAGADTDAKDEAERIHSARRLNPVTGSSAPAHQVLARVRTRRRSGSHRRFWLFTFPCVTPFEQMVWQAVLGLADSPRALPARSAYATRDFLDPSALGLEPLVRHHAVATAEGVSRSLAELANRHIQREEAIVTCIRERHARMSAVLLQPGLFDSRVERQASERDETLREVLSRSALRIEQLSGLAAVRADAPTLVFGLLRD